MTTADTAAIFCDESGHDGENLIGGTTPVLAHSSLNIGLEEATELVAYIRTKTRAQSPELKAGEIMRNSQVVDDLFGERGQLVGRAQVYLVEKAYFAVGKIIDLLIEEEAYRNGVDLYAGGHAKAMADDLYELGPRAMARDGWNDLVSAFTSLMRTKQRKGGPKETVEDFFEKIDKYRLTARRAKVATILGLLWKTRDHADTFQTAIEEGLRMRSLDPLQTSLYQLAYTWHKKLDKPLVIVHDEQTALTEPILKTLVEVANNGTPHGFNLPNFRFPLVGVMQVDSKADPRIQLADIAAGFTRQVAESVLQGTEEEKCLMQARRVIHFNSIWGDSASWEKIRPREEFAD